jgi:hypothetical protein
LLRDGQAAGWSTDLETEDSWKELRERAGVMRFGNDGWCWGAFDAPTPSFMCRKKLS